VMATKHLYERGSAESKQPRGILPNRIEEALREHSLSIFLLITAALWLTLFVHMDVQGKWGRWWGTLYRSGRRSWGSCC